MWVRVTMASLTIIALLMMHTHSDGGVEDVSMHCLCKTFFVCMGVWPICSFLSLCVLVCVCTAVHIISISILLTWSCSSQSEFSVLSAGVVSSLWDLSKWQGTPHSTTAAFISLALYSLSFCSVRACTHTHTLMIDHVFVYSNASTSFSSVQYTVYKSG